MKNLSDEKGFCYFTIVIDTFTFPVHEVVLAAISKNFEAMLQNDKRQFNGFHLDYYRESE